MVSHYAQYMKEREGLDTIENDNGFISYKFIEDGCYIHTVFVQKESRGSLAMVDLCEKVRRVSLEKGCHKVFCTVVPSLPGSTYTIEILIRYGFILDSATNNFICLKKEI